MKPYPFQTEMIEELKDRLTVNNYRKRIVVQLQTGGGKTVIGSLIAKEQIDKGVRVCILVHRIEIFKSFFSSLLQCGITPGLIQAGGKVQQGHRCYLGMVETVKRRQTKGLLDHLGIGMYIMDEVHLGNYQKFISEQKVPVIGLTATPKAASRPQLNSYFDDIVCGPSVKELIEIGRLVPARHFSVNHDFSKVKLKNGEFDDKALKEEFKNPVLYTGAVEDYLKYGNGERAMCYNIDVEHSIETMKQFIDAGISAFHVDGDTSKEDRDHIFQMFESGQIQVLNNVGVATTGYDNPGIKIIILNLATMSLVKYKQMIGRGARALEGKDHFKIFDKGRNWVRHGFFDDDTNWAYIFGRPEEAAKARKAKTDQKECSNCTIVIPIVSRVCPYCNHAFQRKDVEDAILQHGTVEEIKEYRLQNLPIHLRKKPNELTYKELIEYGKAMGYKPSWAYIQNKLRSKKRQYD